MVRAENDVLAATAALLSVTGIAGSRGKRSPADDLRVGWIPCTPVFAAFPGWEQHQGVWQHLHTSKTKVLEPEIMDSTRT